MKKILWIRCVLWKESIFPNRVSVAPTVEDVCGVVLGALDLKNKILFSWFCFILKLKKIRHGGQMLWLQVLFHS